MDIIYVDSKNSKLTISHNKKVRIKISKEIQDTHFELDVLEIFRRAAYRVLLMELGYSVRTSLSTKQLDSCLQNNRGLRLMSNGKGDLGGANVFVDGKFLYDTEGKET